MYNISVLWGDSIPECTCRHADLNYNYHMEWRSINCWENTFCKHNKVYNCTRMSCFCWIGHYNTHKTNYFWNYLQRKESAGILKIMDWTPQSPDRNSIEQFWGDMENKLGKEKGKESLWLELQNAWDNISVEVLRKYMWHYAREMCCCNIHYLVYCCAQNNHLHVSWKMEKGETPPPHDCKAFGCTAIHNKALYKCIIHSWIFSNEIMFGRQKRSVKYFNNFGHHCIYIPSR